MGRVSDGNGSASGNSRFEIYVDWSVSYGEDGFYVEWSRWLEVTRGNFSGTRINTSWDGQVSVTTGTYARQSGTDGPYAYGSSWSMGISCDYQGGGHYAACTASETAYSPQWTPRAVSGVSAERTASGAMLSWSRNVSGARPYGGYYVQRRTDDGSYSTVATLSSGETTSWEDRSTAPGHAYRYRVAPYNANAAGEYAEAAGTVYSTPATPSIVETGRVSNTTVYLNLSNPCRIAERLDVQVSTDAKTWSDLASFDGIVTTCQVDPGDGAFWFRARNVRGSDPGAWSAASEKVVTIAPPAAPSIVAPATEVVASDSQPVVLKWRHNPVDGSAQTSAVVSYTVDGTTTEKTVDGDVQQLEMPSVAANSSVSWSVKTRGTHADYGPPSAVGAFSVRERPSIALNVPETIGQLPVKVSITYDDASGSFAGARLTVSRDGAVVYSKEIGLDGEVSADELLFADGSTYRFSVSARSTSSLQATTWADATVRYTPAHPATLAVEMSEETGCPTLVCRWDNAIDDGLADAVCCDVYRIDPDGTSTPIATGMANGGSCIDRYAPLGVGFAYVAQTVAESGARNSVRFEQHFASAWWYLLWGDGKSARAKWNPSQQTKLTRPEKTRIRYAGRKYPVSYDGTAGEETRTVEGRVSGAGELARFESFMDDGGRGVYKSLVGEVVHVDGEVSITNLFDRSGVEADVSVEMTRIDGGE